MTSLEDVVDPRVAVLIVWAIFFCIFIVLPSLCIRCLGCCHQNHRHHHDEFEDGGLSRDAIMAAHAAAESEAYGGWDRYMFLSAQKKRQIDEMRTDAIKRYLQRFSLSLDKSHLVRLNHNEGGVEEENDKVSGGEEMEEGDYYKEGLLLRNSSSTRGDCDEECPPESELERDMASPDDFIIRAQEVASPDDYIVDNVQEQEETSSSFAQISSQIDEEYCLLELGLLDNDEEKQEVEEQAPCDSNSNKNKEGITVIDIIAPPGQLGLQLKESATNQVVIESISRDGPLYAKLKPGDVILAVDDRHALNEEDMQYRAVSTIALLLSSRIDNPQRKITIQRGGGAAGSVNDNVVESMEETKEDEEQKVEEDIEPTEMIDEEYTHVRIPYPGFDHDGKQVMDEKEKEKSTKQKQQSSSKRFHFSLSRMTVDESIIGNSSDSNGQEEKGSDSTETNNDDADKNQHDKSQQHQQQQTNRTVPHFCAICLGEYQPTDTISWSSNKQCTHVFHTDCIVQWLNTLGRKKSKNQSFLGVANIDPSSHMDVIVRELLNYSLECPCCRQEFISRLVLEREDEYYYGSIEEETTTAVVGGDGDGNV